MNWQRTNREERLIQQKDEKHFFEFFNTLNYNPKKLDDGNVEKAPDYLLSNHSIEIIVEIKSKFGNQDYTKIYSKLVSKVNKLPYGFDYTFQHCFGKMPTDDQINLILSQLKDKLINLPKPIEFPFDLSLGLWEYNETFKLIGQGNHLPEIEKTTITLWGINSSGYMNCDTLSGSYHGYPGTRDKAYFENTLNRAKRQLHQYLYNKPVGIIYFNHSDSSWSLFDIMSLFGDLDFKLQELPRLKKWIINSGRNKIIGENDKTWLSFFGFWRCNEDSSILSIYRNGFSQNKVPIDYFKIPDCNVYTIGPIDDNGNIINDIPFLN